MLVDLIIMESRKVNHSRDYHQKPYYINILQVNKYSQVNSNFKLKINAVHKLSCNLLFVPNFIIIDG